MRWVIFLLLLELFLFGVVLWKLVPMVGEMYKISFILSGSCQD